MQIGVHLGVFILIHCLDEGDNITNVDKRNSSRMEIGSNDANETTSSSVVEEVAQDSLCGNLCAVTGKTDLIQTVCVCNQNYRLL